MQRWQLIFSSSSVWPTRKQKCGTFVYVQAFGFSILIIPAETWGWKVSANRHRCGCVTAPQRSMHTHTHPPHLPRASVLLHLHAHNIKTACYNYDSLELAAICFLNLMTSMVSLPAIKQLVVEIPTASLRLLKRWRTKGQGDSREPHNLVNWSQTQITLTEGSEGHKLKAIKA